MFYISQLNDDDCGFASLKTLLATINKDERYLFLPQDEEHGAYSFQELVNIAKQYGANLLGVKITIDQLKECDQFPIIATITTGLNSHAVVITSIKFGFVTYIDPALGIKHVSLKKFKNMFLEKCLIVQDNNPVELENIEFYSSKNKIILYTLQLLSAVCCILGVYFFDNKIYGFLSYLFLIGFLILEVSLRYYLVNLMKIMDTNFEDYICKNNIFSIDILKKYEVYKKNAITSGITTLFALIASIFIVVIFLLNNYMNFIFVIVDIVLAIIQVAFIDPYIKGKSINLSSKENSLAQVNDIDNYLSSVHNLHELSYKIGGLQLFVKYINIILIILVTYLTMRLSNISSTNYLLFYICFEIYLFQQLVSIFSFQSKSDEAKRSKCHLINKLFCK